MNPIVFIEMYNVCDPKKTDTHTRSILDLRGELRNRLNNPDVELNICATSLYVETDPLLIKVTIYPEQGHGSVLETISRIIRPWITEHNLDKHRANAPIRIYGIVPENAQRIPWMSHTPDGTAISCTSPRIPDRHAV